MYQHFGGGRKPEWVGARSALQGALGGVPLADARPILRAGLIRNRSERESPWRAQRIAYGRRR